LSKVLAVFLEIQKLCICADRVSMQTVAKEIMEKAPIAISLNRKLVEAIAFQASSVHGSVPVLDLRGLLVGVLTDINLIKIKLIANSRGDVNETLMSYTHLLSKAEFVQENTDLSSVVKKLIKVEHRQVYVVDDKGLLKGMITPKSVLTFFDQSSVKMPDTLKHLLSN
jgi:CBS domain-containing protein